MTATKLAEQFADHCLVTHEAQGERRLLCLTCCAKALRAAQAEAIERCEELVRSYCPKPAAYGRFPDRELPSLGGKLDMLHQILSRLKALKEEG